MTIRTSDAALLFQEIDLNERRCEAYLISFSRVERVTSTVAVARAPNFLHGTGAPPQFNLQPATSPTKHISSTLPHHLQTPPKWSSSKKFPTRSTRSSRTGPKKMKTNGTQTTVKHPLASPPPTHHKTNPPNSRLRSLRRRRRRLPRRIAPRPRLRPQRHRAPHLPQEPLQRRVDRLLVGVAGSGLQREDVVGGQHERAVVGCAVGAGV